MAFVTAPPGAALEESVEMRTSGSGSHDDAHTEGNTPTENEEMGDMPNVKVARDERLGWAVWLEDEVVGHYIMVGDALAYASLLECDPRERNQAIAS